jgi:hypothetical protein
MLGHSGRHSYKIEFDGKSCCLAVITLCGLLKETIEKHDKSHDHLHSTQNDIANYQLAITRFDLYHK